MGGGASSKLCTGTGRIERIFAPKYPLEYIQRSDKVVADKQKIVDFYNALG
jgi:oxygen-independent coproporphyrinogen-3 oxidase